MNTLTPTQIELLKNNTEDIKAISLAWLMMDNATQNSWDVSFDSFASQFEDKKEWKILSFSPQSGGNPCTFFAGDYDIGIKERLKEGRKIHSVQYKSETLTVGDDTDKGKIEKFRAHLNNKNEMIVYMESGQAWNISEVKKIERKILTTYDCVSIYKHFQFVYSLDTKDYATKWKLTAGDFLKDYGLLDYVLCFSTEEIRDEYITLNAPRLSVNDAMDKAFKYMNISDNILLRDELISLVKSKQ